MNTKIEIFKSEQFGEIRTLTDEKGDCWFVASDIAKVLGYSEASKLTRMLDDDEKGHHIVETLGGNQAVTTITEGGLYHAILKSRVERANEFRRWVTDEVLPQIRKTGGYIPTAEEDDEFTILAKALLISQRTIELKNQQIEDQKKVIKEQLPSVRFANAVTSCPDSILIRDLAKLITQNGVKIGAARLFYWLRLKGYLFQRETRPIQKWVEAGLFDTNVSVIGRGRNSFERITTKVTGKGQRYFVDGFVSGKFCAENGRFA